VIRTQHSENGYKLKNVSGLKWLLPILALGGSYSFAVAAVPVSPCKTSQLSAMEDRKEADGIDGGAGHHAMTIAIQNRSSSSCALKDVPVLRLSYLPKRPFAVHVCRNCDDYLFSRQPVKDVVLEPMGSAYLVLGYNSNDGAGTCTEADPKFGPRASYATMALDLRLPKQNDPLRIVFPEWRSCGAIDVTPFLDKPPNRANSQR
jgi:hypothetical protein